MVIVKLPNGNLCVDVDLSQEKINSTFRVKAKPVSETLKSLPSSKTYTGHISDEDFEYYKSKGYYLREWLFTVKYVSADVSSTSGISSASWGADGKLVKSCGDSISNNLRIYRYYKLLGQSNYYYGYEYSILVVQDSDEDGLIMVDTAGSSYAKTIGNAMTWIPQNGKYDDDFLTFDYVVGELSNASEDVDQSKLDKCTQYVGSVSRPPALYSFNDVIINDYLLAARWPECVLPRSNELTYSSNDVREACYLQNSFSYTSNVNYSTTTKKVNNAYLSGDDAYVKVSDEYDSQLENSKVVINDSSSYTFVCTPQRPTNISVLGDTIVYNFSSSIVNDNYVGYKKFVLNKNGSLIYAELRSGAVLGELLPNTTEGKFLFAMSNPDFFSTISNTTYNIGLVEKPSLSKAEEDVRNLCVRANTAEVYGIGTCESLVNISDVISASLEATAPNLNDVILNYSDTEVSDKTLSKDYRLISELPRTADYSSTYFLYNNNSFANTVYAAFSNILQYDSGCNGTPYDLNPSTFVTDLGYMSKISELINQASEKATNAITTSSITAGQSLAKQYISFLNSLIGNYTNRIFCIKDSTDDDYVANNYYKFTVSASSIKSMISYFSNILSNSFTLSNLSSYIKKMYGLISFDFDSLKAETKITEGNLKTVRLFDFYDGTTNDCIEVTKGGKGFFDIVGTSVLSYAEKKMYSIITLYQTNAITLTSSVEPGNEVQHPETQLGLAGDFSFKGGHCNGTTYWATSDRRFIRFNSGSYSTGCLCLPIMSYAKSKVDNVVDTGGNITTYSTVFSVNLNSLETLARSYDFVPLYVSSKDCNSTSNIDRIYPIVAMSTITATISSFYIKEEATCYFNTTGFTRANGEFGEYNNFSFKYNEKFYSLLTTNNLTDSNYTLNYSTGKLKDETQDVSIMGTNDISTYLEGGSTDTTSHKYTFRGYTFPSGYAYNLSYDTNCAKAGQAMSVKLLTDIPEVTIDSSITESITGYDTEKLTITLAQYFNDAIEYITKQAITPLDFCCRVPYYGTDATPALTSLITNYSLTTESVNSIITQIDNASNYITSLMTSATDTNLINTYSKTLTCLSKLKVTVNEMNREVIGNKIWIPADSCDFTSESLTSDPTAIYNFIYAKEGLLI